MATPNAPRHTSGLAIQDQSSVPGANMVANHGTRPIMYGLGLFHARGGYRGQFMINVTSCREMMPDPAAYRDCLQESFEELRDACGVSR